MESAGFTFFGNNTGGPIPVRCVATHRLRPAQVDSTVSLRAAAMSARVAQRYPKDSAAIGRHLRHRMPKTVGLRRMRARFECLMSEEADKKLASIRPLYWNGTHPSVFECRVERRTGSRLRCRRSFYLSRTAQELRRILPHLEARPIKSRTSEAFASCNAKSIIGWLPSCLFLG